MRGRDHDTGEFLSPSRSQQRREALAVLELAEQLVALPPARLAQLPLPEEIAALVADTRAIKSHIAHKRQLHFLAKQMRRLDDEALEPVRRQLAHDRGDARRETAQLHAVEAWRERLIDEGDVALGALLEAHPEADRQHLRTLARNARQERERNKPPHAARELFRSLRALLLDGDEDAAVDALDDDAPATDTPAHDG